MATNYALDPTGLVQVLIETTSGQSTHYLPGLAQYGGNAWNYYLPDRLGSVRQLTDASSAVGLARSYEPFGNVLAQVGGGQSVFGYTGEQTDSTGLVFLRARYYNPAVGRFLTADSVIPDPLSSGGWNRYGYGYNNPVKFTDPSGRTVELPPCPICDIKIDVSDWPSWAQMATGIALTVASAGNPPLHYDPYQQAIVGPTRYDMAVSAMVGFATPIGVPPTVGVLDEIPFSLSNRANGYLSRNQATLINRYEPGAAFSGIYDLETGQFLACPSGDTVLNTGQIPPIRVPRRAGHTQVAELMYQGPKQTSVGFTLFYEGPGELSVEFLSGVNRRFSPNRLAPTEFQQPIIDAVQNSTGFIVRGR